MRLDPISVVGLLAGATLCLGLAACEQSAGPPTTSSAAFPPTASATVSETPPDAAATSLLDAAPAEPVADQLTLVAGGDVNLGRVNGQLLLRDPSHNNFVHVEPLLRSGDLRFLNLETTISEQGGETVSPHNRLVFTAPPVAAKTLVANGVDIVALANNHAWDYGKDALFETFEHLDRAGVAYVGAGRTQEAAYQHRIVERQGLRVAFVAFTSIWNQPMRPHPGRAFIADGKPEPVLAAVRAARADQSVDFLVVSFHGGQEYVATPLASKRELLRATIDAGADVVIGHHPHVLQRVEFVGDRPVYLSLGNFVMGMKPGKPWTELGALARVTLSRTAPPVAEICPFRTVVRTPMPLAGDPKRQIYESMFRIKFGRLLHWGAVEQPDGGAKLGPIGEDGCARLLPTAGDAEAPR